MGWEATFIIVGGIGFLSLGAWLFFYEKPEKQKRLSAAELAYINLDQDEKQVVPTGDKDRKVKWTQLLGYRQTWAFAFGKFMTDGVWRFFLFWLPAYLKAQYGIIDDGVILPLAVVYTMAMIGSINGGWFPMIFIKKGLQVMMAGCGRCLLSLCFR